MLITGDFRPETEFKLTAPPQNMQQAAFIAINRDYVIVTRRLSEILELPEDCPVIANWHGERRTDAFSTTVGYLRKLSEEFGK